MTRAAAYAYSLLRASVPSPDVLVLALARPPVNAFSTDLFAQLRDAFAQASRDEHVRCVVLTSDVDKGFTAGLDLQCVVSRAPCAALTCFRVAEAPLGHSGNQRKRPHAPSQRPCAHRTPPQRRT